MSSHKEQEIPVSKQDLVRAMIEDVNEAIRDLVEFGERLEEEVGD